MEIKTRSLPLACLLQAGRDDRATLGVLRSLPTACLLQAGRDDKATLGFVIPNVVRELSHPHRKH